MPASPDCPRTTARGRPPPPRPCCHPTVLRPPSRREFYRHLRRAEETEQSSSIPWTAFWLNSIWILFGIQAISGILRFLERRRFRLNQPLHPLHERLHLHRSFGLVLAADPHVDFARLHLAVAQHELEWHLLHGMFADFGVHLLVAHIDVYPHTGSLQLVADFVSVGVVLLADRDDDHLYRREPHRERARVVLDEHAEEALLRAVERAVYHQRLVPPAVLADILQREALRQGEVELHGRELPQAADRVHQLDVDLRPVERGLAGDQLVLDVAPLQRLLQRALSQLPLIVAAGIGLAVVRVPGRELHLVLLEAVGAQHGQREVNAADHLVLDLFRRAEDMSVVLGEAADAQQPVHHA